MGISVMTLTAGLDLLSSHLKQWVPILIMVKLSILSYNVRGLNAKVK